MSKSVFEIVETTSDEDFRSTTTTLGFFGAALFAWILVTALICASIVATGLERAGKEASKNITNAIELQAKMQAQQLQRVQIPREQRS